MRSASKRNLAARACSSTDKITGRGVSSGMVQISTECVFKAADFSVAANLTGGRRSVATPAGVGNVSTRHERVPLHHGEPVHGHGSSGAGGKLTSCRYIGEFVPMKMSFIDRKTYWNKSPARLCFGYRNRISIPNVATE